VTLTPQFGILAAELLQFVPVRSIHQRGRTFREIVGILSENFSMAAASSKEFSTDCFIPGDSIEQIQTYYCLQVDGIEQLLHYSPGNVA